MTQATPARPTLAARIERAWTEGGALQWALRPVALLFGLLVGLRRRLYRLGLLQQVAAPVPMLVVGNRIVGGAGKTPTTLALVQALRAAGWSPGIVSRGHGGTVQAPEAVRPDSPAARVGDEPLLLRRRARVPVWVAPDRAAAARALCAAHPEVDLLLCDDGLQHLRLKRDLEVVLFDERGAGNGWLLPAGPLREPIDAPSDVPQLVLYNAPAPSTPLPGACATRAISGLVELSAWWQGAGADPAVFAALREQPVHACAGIGQPERFFAALRGFGLAVLALPLPDHHDFRELPGPRDLQRLVVTEKDAVKLDPERLRRERPGLTVWVAPLALQLPAAFVQAVIAALPARPRGATEG